jgi:hypothetical protein
MTLVAKGVVIILTFSILSFFLSISGDMAFLGLGGIFNFILSPILGITGILIFLLTCWMSKNERARITVIVLICSYLIYSGLVFLLKPGNLPIPFD